MNIQRLRNLTTGRRHTEMGHIYEDLGIILGETGLMTHMLPRARRAVLPWLQEHVKDPLFWDGKHDQDHTGELELPEPSEADRKAMWERYANEPDPLAGKEVVVVVSDAEILMEKSSQEQLATDPLRENEQMHGLTGIYVRARGKAGRETSFDIAELDSASLTAWLRRDGGDNLLAENCVRLMLGHDQIPQK